MCTTLGCILKTIPYPFLAFLPQYSLKKPFYFLQSLFLVVILLYSTEWLAVPGGKQDILWVMFTVISLCLLFAVFSFDLRVADVATSIKS